MPEFGHHVKVVALIFTTVLLLIGCSPKNTPPPTTPISAAVETDAEAARHPSPTVTKLNETAVIDQDLDLREANVLEVKYEPLDDGRYRFDVTLLHDDDGEAPSYANSWQVWDIQGNLLGERVLTHGHGTQAFTRSATIEIPEGVLTVLVRGHDMQHGHGGQSMRVDLESGEAKAYLE